ncbi:hypothetical protein E8E12_000933 [Didymella heteroderae]|uniref:PD-(D/E)XK nuclease-like domain-containing protein n=1 Tax=Didymella heteroderae TaxID=1769908 RepID=A0A9P4WFS9_9PLEO|nr:hypothetical protein E8E12_000933 [Didymella heteroderae]
MATTPPLSPSIAAAQRSRVLTWVEELYDKTLHRTDTLSPPLTPVRDPPLKRKREPSSTLCTCTMSARTSSPKRLRRDSNSEILPVHSMSAAGPGSNASALLLNERNTFSPLGSQSGARSPRRPNSPSRDSIAILASAYPPTITEPSSGLKNPPPIRVRNVMERLETGLDKGWIPEELRKLIEDDRDFGYQRIERHAWGESTANTLALPITDHEGRIEAVHVLRKVKEIWLNARVCELQGRDENAWCMDVMLPLVKLALRLDGARKLWLQSVQSQNISTEFLSSVPDASGKSRVLDRKADFTLSFSHMPSPGLSDLYTRLRTANSSIVSHMADAFTRTTALFSCVEVKPASGDRTEAGYQLSIWMAASLRKKIQLARRAGLVDKSGLVEPCFSIVGHETRVYFAFMASEEMDAVQILGPEDGLLGLCETRSVSGIFRALRLWRNVIAYGRDGGSDGFWGGFMGEVLHKLAGDADVGYGAPTTTVEERTIGGVCPLAT